ncbi:MAG TPA: hypothetical protein VFE46_15130 [Pirellulales bacterium]|jgi:hypothetical protein|nr:hypothetical protein [Pirellulales bacterium]
MDKPNKQGRRKLQKVVTWQRLVILPIMIREGRDVLTDGQYLHIKDHLKELTGFGARKFTTQLRIAPFEEFWELKEKGGVLGRKNIRIYFFHDTDDSDIILLMTDKKENDGQASPSIKYILRNRLRLYRQGHFAGQLFFYVRPEKG